ncbi:hypothetical protein HB364_26205 [Pseudoflavitalea sp. X16]|uniref:hypothetical protein n=1 Tax=Paraflavitalea devenefica TaxID=2716334 RepID=UPI001422733E|nr:hypothetical protein [Paraflavitalea devenefica]NII28604.1 hypothetical protein [Paraflavitalea devenefica]
MSKTNNITFGDSKIFAIEIAPSTNSKKYYLRLWFQDNAFGDFKRSGVLLSIIKGYFKFLNHIDSLYEKKFDVMTDREIFDDIVNVVQRNLPQEQEDVLIQRMMSYEFPTGDYQLTDFGIVLINVKQEGIVKLLIYEMSDKNKSPQFYSYAIPTKYFFEVYESFVQYAHDNNLFKSK